jgi:hypothetical protein
MFGSVERVVFELTITHRIDVSFSRSCVVAGKVEGQL